MAIIDNANQVEVVREPDEIVARIRAGGHLLVAVGEKRPWYFDGGPAVDGRSVKRLEREGRLDTRPCHSKPPAPAILTVPPRIPGLTADEHAGVEALFTQDLPDGPLARLRPAVGRSLVDKGFAETAKAQLGKDRFGAVEITAHRLTHAGHFAYCAWAAEQPDDDPDDDPAS